MPGFVPPKVDLSDEAARSLAVAMRDVARADGSHPREEALIEEFAQGIELGDAPADLSLFDTPQLQETFIQSLALVALADGAISDPERQVMLRYAEQLGLGEGEVASCTANVAHMMLSQLAGVKTYKDTVVALGRRMGLDKFTIEHALSDES